MAGYSEMTDAVLAMRLELAEQVRGELSKAGLPMGSDTAGGLGGVVVEVDAVGRRIVGVARLDGDKHDFLVDAVVLHRVAHRRERIELGGGTDLLRSLETVARAMWRRVLGVATRVSLDNFESPEFYNRLSRVQTNAMSRPNQVTQGLLTMAGAMAAYGLGVLALWGNHRWRNTIVLRALVAGTIPFGSLVFVRWADKRRRRELSGDWRLGRNGSYAYSLPERIVAWATRNPWLAALSAAVIVGAAAALVVWGGPRLTWTR